MLSYQEILKEILPTSSPGYKKRDLSSMRLMCSLLGHPEKKMAIAHVTGTNGKGSVCLKIAKAFEFSGYRCGLFTSPHISSFRERVRINNSMISEESTANILSEIKQVAKKANTTLSYFEYCTLLALVYFSEQRVDFAVLEVGIGGRFDATNVVLPEISIITSIGIDHAEILGHSEKKITLEKGGIIKPFIPVVTGPNVPKRPIYSLALPLYSPIIETQGRYSHYALENSAIAETVLRKLSEKFSLNESAISRALSIDPPCRFEIVPSEYLARSKFSNFSNQTIILDVAHNPQGIEHLIQRLKASYPKTPFQFAVSFSRNKDIKKCSELLLSAAKSIYIIDDAHPRLAKPAEIQKFFYSPIFTGTPDQVLEKALSSKEGILVITGSFFIMRPIRHLLGYQESEDLHHS